MSTGKFTSEPGTPEYHASEWLISIHNAYRELDHVISQLPDIGEYSERFGAAGCGSIHWPREQMGWSERTRDIASRSLDIVIGTLKLPNM